MCFNFKMAIKYKNVLKWTLVIIIALVVMWIVYFYYPSGFQSKEIEGFYEQIGTVNRITLTCTEDRKSTRLNSSHEWISRMPSSA